MATGALIPLAFSATDPLGSAGLVFSAFFPFSDVCGWEFVGDSLVSVRKKPLGLHAVMSPENSRIQKHRAIFLSIKK